MSIAILLCGLFYFISDFYSTNTYFQHRLEATKEGNSSGRDDIYETLLNHILSNGNLFGMIFGEGALATTKITWTAAHNDWLEFMVDMGLIGFVSYVVYWGQFGDVLNNIIKFQIIIYGFSNILTDNMKVLVIYVARKFIFQLFLLINYVLLYRGVGL